MIFVFCFYYPSTDRSNPPTLKATKVRKKVINTFSKLQPFCVYALRRQLKINRIFFLAGI